jgi:zinc D-Ala-D-Ala carboxypeptidase
VAALVAIAVMVVAESPGTATSGRIGPAVKGPGPLAACAVGDTPASRRGYDDWAATLLDTERTLGEAYAPPDLVRVEVDHVAGGQLVRVRAFVAPRLTALVRAAGEAGAALTVVSAYRSFRDQTATFASLDQTYGHEFAIESAARPGHSEHQLGTTVDFGGDTTWLAENAWRFGFVMSYPPARSPALTCYKPETWHFRYFGIDRAAAIQRSGLSPREWLWTWGGH